MVFLSEEIMNYVRRLYRLPGRLFVYLSIRIAKALAQ